MVLGYIVMCGLGPLSPNSIEGCRIDTMSFPTLAACEETNVNVVVDFNLPDPYYIDDSGCILIGTGL